MLDLRGKGKCVLIHPMDETEQIDRFNDGLDKYIDTFVLEHDVSTAATIGALYLAIHRLAEEAQEP